MKKESVRGFTLIELLVVIAIIGILASIVLASLSTARQKSRDARRLADLKQVQSALELYYSIQNSYPPTNTWANVQSSLSPTYMNTVPVDPLYTSAAANYNYQATNGASTPAACAVAPCQGFLIRAQTEAANYMAAAVTGVGAVSSANCSVSGSSPYNYCLKM